jgi:hypothetical protein
MALSFFFSKKKRRPMSRRTSSSAADTADMDGCVEMQRKCARDEKGCRKTATAAKAATEENARVCAIRGRVLDRWLDMVRDDLKWPDFLKEYGEASVFKRCDAELLTSDDVIQCETQNAAVKDITSARIPGLDRSLVAARLERLHTKLAGLCAQKQSDVMTQWIADKARCTEIGRVCATETEKCRTRSEYKAQKARDKEQEEEEKMRHNQKAREEEDKRAKERKLRQRQKSGENITMQTEDEPRETNEPRPPPASPSLATRLEEKKRRETAVATAVAVAAAAALKSKRLEEVANVAREEKERRELETAAAAVAKTERKQPREERERKIREEEAARVELERKRRQEAKERQAREEETGAATATAEIERKRQWEVKEEKKRNGETKSNVVYMHISRLDRDHAQARYRQYVIGKRLGKGSFGEVNASCRVTPTETCSECIRNSSRCPYAMKIIVITADAAGEVAEDGAYRDVYYLQKLAHIRVDDRPIVPKLHDAWMEEKSESKTPPNARDGVGGRGVFGYVRPDPEPRHFYIVMESFDGDMDKMTLKRFVASGRRELSTGKPSALYHESELTRMFRIAAAMGVLDGDIKPDQFLYRAATIDRNVLASQLQDVVLQLPDVVLQLPDVVLQLPDVVLQLPVSDLVITDFGFVGGDVSRYKASLGWLSNHSWSTDSARVGDDYGCPASGFTPTTLAFIHGDPAYTNVVILEMSLFLLTETLVVHERDPRTVSLFGGVSGLDRVAATRSVCSRYTNDRVNMFTRTATLRGYNGLFQIPLSTLHTKPSPTSLPAQRPPRGLIRTIDDTKDEYAGSGASATIKEKEPKLMFLWKAVVEKFATQSRDDRKPQYKDLAQMIHPDKWSGGTNPEYERIAAQTTLRPLRPELAAFVSLLHKQVSTWSLTKRQTFFNSIYKQLQSARK